MKPRWNRVAWTPGGVLFQLREPDGTRTLKELGRSYLTITQDVTRVMNRIKALYRSWAIPCSGTTVYARRQRSEWLAKVAQPEFGFERNGSTSNWICCKLCVSKRDASYCWKTTSMLP